MNVNQLHQLGARWRDDASRLRELGQEGAARMSERHADELDTTHRDWLQEALTLEEAEQESGYSRSRLQHLVADGDLPNAGERGSPRIRRCDLPSKPGNRPRRHPDGTPDLAAEVERREGLGRYR